MTLMVDSLILGAARNSGRDFGNGRVAEYTGSPNLRLRRLRAVAPADAGQAALSRPRSGPVAGERGSHPSATGCNRDRLPDWNATRPVRRDVGRPTTSCRVGSSPCERPHHEQPSARRIEQRVATDSSVTSASKRSSGRCCRQAGRRHRSIHHDRRWPSRRHSVGFRSMTDTHGRPVERRMPGPTRTRTSR